MKTAEGVLRNHATVDMESITAISENKVEIKGTVVIPNGDNKISHTVMTFDNNTNKVVKISPIGTGIHQALHDEMAE